MSASAASGSHAGGRVASPAAVRGALGTGEVGAGGEGGCGGSTCGGGLVGGRGVVGVGGLGSRGLPVVSKGVRLLGDLQPWEGVLELQGDGFEDLCGELRGQLSEDVCLDLLSGLDELSDLRLNVLKGQKQQSENTEKGRGLQSRPGGRGSVMEGRPGVDRSTCLSNERSCFSSTGRGSLSTKFIFSSNSACTSGLKARSIRNVRSASAGHGARRGTAASRERGRRWLRHAGVLTACS